MRCVGEDAEEGTVTSNAQDSKSRVAPAGAPGLKLMRASSRAHAHCHSRSCALQFEASALCNMAGRAMEAREFVLRRL